MMSPHRTPDWLLERIALGELPRTSSPPPATVWPTNRTAPRASPPWRPTRAPPWRPCPPTASPAR